MYGSWVLRDVPDFLGWSAVCGRVRPSPTAAALPESSSLPLSLPPLFFLCGGYGGRKNLAAVSDRDVDDDHAEVLGLFREFTPIGVSGGDPGIQLNSFRSSFGRARPAAVIARRTLRFELSACLHAAFFRL